MAAEKSKSPASPQTSFQATPGERDFVITRIIDAPRALVFKVWTEPKHMAQWWGPHGFTNPVCELDARPGGAWRIVMRGPDGADHPAKGIYREVVPPERIVMTINHSELSDEWHDLVNPNRDKEVGKPALEGITTVTFEEQGGKTKLTIQMRFESAAIRDALLRIGMNEGWSQSLERLQLELAKTAKNDHGNPTLGNGKICYIEIPAIDINRSASFYKEVFGWRIRQRRDGHLAFDDAVGQVSGTWVSGRKAAAEPGLLVYIMVDSVAATIDAVVAHGGKIVQPIGMDAPEITARFSDPAGNVMGLYEQPTGES